MAASSSAEPRNDQSTAGWLGIDDVALSSFHFPGVRSSPPVIAPVVDACSLGTPAASGWRASGLSGSLRSTAGSPHRARALDVVTGS